MNRIFSVLIYAIFGIVTLVTVFPLSSAVSGESTTWIDVDGNSGMITADDGGITYEGATWNLWVKQHQFTPNAVLVSKYTTGAGNRAFIIRTVRENSLSVVLSENGLTTETDTSTSFRQCGIRANNQWTMITVTYNGSQILYYRNGVLCNSDQTSVRWIHPTSKPVTIGGGYGGYFNGSIDEVRIYRRALTREQIQRLYQESAHGGDRGPSVPVLLYHQINKSGHSADVVTPDQFQNQMTFLAHEEFHPITVEHFAAWKRGERALPSKPIVLFFDDGWRSVWEEGVPVLDRHGFRASVGIVSRYANLTSSSRYMNWNQLRSLQQKDWSIEAHSLTHPRMTQLQESSVRREMEGSLEDITNNLGRAPLSFIFPYHASNELLAEWCSEYYQLCWTSGGNIRRPGYNYQNTQGMTYRSLQRVSITNTTSMEQYYNALGKDSFLVGIWDLEEGSGSLATDSSNHGRAARLTGNAKWQQGLL